MHWAISQSLIHPIQDKFKGGPGKLEKVDGEYKRKGPCSIFVAVAPTLGKRIIKLTDTRKDADKKSSKHYVASLNNHYTRP
jgi:hypothetical protein